MYTYVYMYSIMYVCTCIYTCKCDSVTNPYLHVPAYIRSCCLPCRGGGRPAPPSFLPSSHHQAALIHHCGVWAEGCPALRGQWRSPDLRLVGPSSNCLLYSKCQKSVTSHPITVFMVGGTVSLLLLHRHNIGSLVVL